MKKTTLMITAATFTLLTAGLASARDSVNFSVSIGVPAPVYVPRQVVYVPEPEPVQYRVIERHTEYPMRPVEPRRETCTKIVKKVYVNDHVVEKRVTKIHDGNFDRGNGYYRNHDRHRDGWNRNRHEERRDDRHERNGNGRHRW